MHIGTIAKARPTTPCITLLLLFLVISETESVYYITIMFSNVVNNNIIVPMYCL